MSSLERIQWPVQKNMCQTRMEDFIIDIQEKIGKSFIDYNEFHRWTVDEKEEFWSYLFSFFSIVYSGGLKPAKASEGFIPYDWFPNVQLNFAENLLTQGKDEDRAIDFFHESGRSEQYTYQQLRSQVYQLQEKLRGLVGVGDVLACYMPNIPQTIMSMLGASSLGATFTSTSCDFGIQGVVDRFSQSRPKVLVMVDGYQYGGKDIDLTQRIPQLLEQLPSLEKIVLIDFIGKAQEFQNPKVELWNEWIDVNRSFREQLSFKRLDFGSPLYIMYSSGTTGKPKCIVHSVGGTLLQHLKELVLHSNLTREKNIFYFTTCGWMMWNWLVSSLGVGATVVLYEGSPGYPSLSDFMQRLADRDIHYLGTSPKFLRALELDGWDQRIDFPHLEMVLSTGAPLLPEQFDFVEKNLRPGVHVSSICGGTDIIGCFMLGNPIREVRRGTLQGAGLGMDIACLDYQGQKVFGQEGELVCMQSFVSQPIGFLNDDNNVKFKDAYFNRFEGIWHHGDFITINDDQSVIVHGRSDATLNPGGVRIGTGEIYRQTEKLDFIDDTVCVAREAEGDVDIVLFVKTKAGSELNGDQIDQIKQLIRRETTPRHVPKEVHQVEDIPYTRSGKKMELVVGRLINGKAIQNIEAVANPDSLKQYKQFQR
jgi:acetoacetyl-CoA synthetase